MAAPVRILIAGFGPFPGVDHNPAQAVAEAIAAAGEPHVHALVLPTVWADAPARLEAERRRLRPEIVLLLGVAADSRVFRLERFAGAFARADLADADGCLLDRARIDDGPERLETTADVPAIRDRLAAAGLETEISSDAGDYLCNFAYRHALAAEGPRAVLFLHLPAAGVLTFDTDVERFTRAARITAAALAEGALHR